MQPGEVIGPGGTPRENSEKPAEEVSPPPPVTPEPETAPAQPESNWQFTDGNEGQPSDPVAPLQSHDPVSWTASEYIAHEKGSSWYFLLGLGVVVLAAIVYFVTKELVSPVVIVIMGIAFGVFGARKPNELTYTLNNTSLTIGPKAYNYGQFKSFTIVDEGAIHSIMLMPLQRFMPPLSVYYDPKDEDKIADALSSYLPYEDRKQDVVDRLMHRVRF